MSEEIYYTVVWETTVLGSDLVNPNSFVQAARKAESQMLDGSHWYYTVTNETTKKTEDVDLSDEINVDNE